MVDSTPAGAPSPAKLPGLETLDRGNGIRPEHDRGNGIRPEHDSPGDAPKKSAFRELLRQEGERKSLARNREQSAGERRRLEEDATDRRGEVQQRHARARETERADDRREVQQRRVRARQTERAENRREQAQEPDAAEVREDRVDGGLIVPLQQAAKNLAEESVGTERRKAASARVVRVAAEARGSQAQTKVSERPSAQISQSALHLQQAVDRTEGQGSPRSVFDLLSFQELLDPDLQVDSGSEEILEKLQQALRSNTDGALDEMGDVVLPQVVRSIAALARNGSNEMRLQLQPPELGELELNIRTADGVVRGEIVVSSMEVKQLLESQLERLRNSMAEQGLELEAIDIELRDDGNQGQPRHDFSNAQENSSAAPILSQWGRTSEVVGETAIPVVAASPSNDDQGIEVDVIT